MKRFLGVLKKIAPKLAGVAAGPAGPIVEGWVADALGVDKNSTPSQLAAAIEADPEAALKLRELETTHETEIYRLEVSDRSNARARDVRLREIGKNNWRADVLALIIVSGLVLSIYLVFTQTVAPGPQRDVLLYLLGTLSAGFVAVVQFEFGSSRGSRNKDLIDLD